MIHTHYRSFLLIFIYFIVSACSHSKPKIENSLAMEGYSPTTDLYIVDCELPGKVKRLGAITYLSPKRALKTTAQDCRIRGGEYVEYDRADYRSALAVWLPLAREGNPEAQNYVGEIYERGVAGEADYQSARHWYQLASAQENTRAMLNLGFLHERGLGVEQNKAEALNYYRRASGIADDNLVLSSQAKQELSEVEAELSKKIALAEKQINYLSTELETVKQGKLDDKMDEIQALQALYAQAKADKESLSSELASITQVFRSPMTGGDLAALPKASNRKLKQINFGRYYALIIGNQHYEHFDDLQSPIRDAERLKQVLEEHYGFTTLLLKNAQEKTILNSINNFYEQIGEQDNLLIYFAGHGEMSKQGFSQKERGYWLPTNAHNHNISNWINNAVISDHLDRLKARSVMVIADSCYAGGLGADKSSLLFGISNKNWYQQALQSGLSRRARIVISSGGEKPVMDGTRSDHSIFTSALINVLENNAQPIRDSELFSRIAVDVKTRTTQLAQQQIPEMKPIREAGHEGGSFFFIPESFN